MVPGDLKTDPFLLCGTVSVSFLLNSRLYRLVMESNQNNPLSREKESGQTQVTTLRGKVVECRLNWNSGDKTSKNRNV